MSHTTTSPPLRRNRDFQLLWVGRMLAGLGAQMGELVLPLLVLRETGSPAKAGLVGAVEAVALLVAVVPSGVVADAVERRRLLVWCELAAAVVAAGLTATVLAERPVLLLILFATAAIAVLGSMYTPAASALLRAAVPADQLGLAMSRIQARGAATRLAGPLLGGALFAFAPALPFVVMTAGLLISFACLLAVRVRSAPARTATLLTPRELTAGFRFIWGQPYLRTFLIFFGMGLNAAVGAVMLVAIMVAAQRDPSGWSSGAIVALAASGYLLGALLAPRLRAHHHPRAAPVATSWICAAVVTSLAVVTTPLAMGGLLAAALLVAAIANVAFETEQLRLTPDHLIGRVQSATMLIALAAQPAGPLAGGLLVDRFGANVAFLVLGTVITTCAAVLTLLLRHTEGR